MGFTTTATLTLKSIDDFHRVLEFVKPDESDTEPQTDEEYKEVMSLYDTLEGPERCAWMARHCTRFYVNFDQSAKELALSWWGRNIQGGYAEEIAELVVAQFPDIEFRVGSFCDADDFKFGLSENGKVRWLELSNEVHEMLDWGIDVDPYVGPTPEQLEELRRRRRARVQEMIDLGVHISLDTWPPTREQFDEEHRLRYPKNNESETEDYAVDDNPDLPF
jgi:hypothetical protein